MLFPIFISEVFYNLLFSVSYYLVLIPTILVTFASFRSPRSLGKKLDKGLKKIALGTTVYTAVFLVYVLIRGGSEGLLPENYVTLFFVVSGIFGSILLILGYTQIFKVSKKLKLFTV